MAELVKLRIRTAGLGNTRYAGFLALALLVGLGSSLVPLAASAGPVPKLNEASRGARIVLLGTAGGPVPRKERHQPATLLVVDGTNYLIDAGDGVSGQLAKISLGTSEITAVFLTHHHYDHTAGLASLIAFRWTTALIGGRVLAMSVFGPPGTTDFVAAGIRYFATTQTIFRNGMASAPMMANFVKAYDIAPGVIYQDEKVRVTATENTHYSTLAMPMTDHGVDRSYSYRFDTKYGAVVFTGDTGPSANVDALAAGADLLVTEVVDVPSVMANFNAQPNMTPAVAHLLEAHMRHEHMTPHAIGTLANAAKVKRVVLTHFAMPDHSEAAARRLANQVGGFYRGPVIAGHDFLEMTVKVAGK